MIGAEKIEGISPLFAQVQRRPVNIEKAPAGSVLSVPFGVGVNSCYCVGCEIIKGAAVPDKLLYGAAGVLDLRHLEKKISGLESAKSTVYSHSYGLHNIFFRFQPEL